MKIAILGAGNIGGMLGKKWAKAGHKIIFGVRNPNSSKTQAALAAVGAGGRAASVSEAIRVAEIVVFSIPWASVPEIAHANAGALDGKILIDATNNFAGAVINNLEALQDAAPKANIFRAFNSVGWEIFAGPVMGAREVDLFYCGPDGEARLKVNTLIAEIGIRPIWVGDNDHVQLVDNLGALWVRLAFQMGWGRGIAFKLVTND